MEEGGEGGCGEEVEEDEEEETWAERKAIKKLYYSFLCLKFPTS
jgi:hypothetical protein